MGLFVSLIEKGYATHFKYSYSILISYKYSSGAIKFEKEKRIKEKDVPEAALNFIKDSYR